VDLGRAGGSQRRQVDRFDTVQLLGRDGFRKPDSGHVLGLTRQAISQHLDVLESAGLLSTRREGRYKFHDLNTDPLKAIVDRWLTPGEEGAKS